VSRPRFLADEDLRFEIVLAVRRLEPSVDISTVFEIGRARSTDAEVLDFANANGLIVVSHDVNTMKAEAESRIADGRGIAGLMLTAQRSSTRSAAESLVLIWAASEAEEWTDRIVFLPI
jgi:predicted nuclease of predicted toxin-antitoxin system